MSNYCIFCMTILYFFKCDLATLAGTHLVEFIDSVQRRAGARDNVFGSALCLNFLTLSSCFLFLLLPTVIFLCVLNLPILARLSVRPTKHIFVIIFMQVNPKKLSSLLAAGFVANFVLVHAARSGETHVL